MKKITLLLSLFFCYTISAQNLSLDFESQNTNYQFIDFDGGFSEKIENPEISGINKSATVVRLIKGIGEVWAGSKIIMPSPIDLTTSRVFKIKVFSPVSGISLLLKFEGDGESFQKKSTPIQKSNVWEELTFDFSAQVVNKLNNQIVLIFDNEEIGFGNKDSTFLIDDITQLTGTNPILPLPVLPLNFESAEVSYPFIDFEGGAAEVVFNPYPAGLNQSSKVIKMVKKRGEASGGSYIQMAKEIDFTKNQIIKMKVWSPIKGKNVSLIFEGNTIGYETFEAESIIPKANEWVELTFDYSVSGLHPPVNNLCNRIKICFDTDSLGDGGLKSTYYFDDLMFIKQN